MNGIRSKKFGLSAFESKEGGVRKDESALLPSK